MLLSLIAFLAVPGYWQERSANGFQWGVYWFAFGWNTSRGWQIWLQYALVGANSFIWNGMFTVLSVLLILLALWAWKSKGARPTVVTFVLSTVLLLLACYGAYDSYSYYWGHADYSYSLIPIEIGLLGLLTIFAYGAVLALARQGAHLASSEKPTAAVVLSSIGGMVLVVVGMLLLVGYTMATVGWYELAIGSMMIVCGIMAYYKRMLTNAWGSAIIVLSMIAGVNLIALAGGISAMRWKARSTASGEGLGGPAAVSTAAIKHCASCGNLVFDDAKFCAHCGATQLARTVGRVWSSEMRYCPNCGSELPPASAFCINCGKPIPAPTVQPAKPPAEKVSGWWYLVPLLFGIIGGIIAWAATKSRDPANARKMLIFGVVWSVLLLLLVIAGAVFYAMSR
jgi:predicted RNA-binding Zn-ribbon protein involved in translation (DUF1610 family)